MKGRSGLSFLTVALVIGFHLIFAGVAQAHHVVLDASAACSDIGLAVINYTVTSWSPNAGEGENTQIDVRINGFLVDSKPFVFATGNTFSGTALAPSGSSATVSALAVGVWGDNVAGGQSASKDVTLPTDCGLPAQGRFTGGGKQIDLTADISITKGLTIHCDKLLSNNLEVNWTGGNNFHMEDHLITLACTDDPNINQNPPNAPLDTLIGEGIGKFNNVDGFTIQFTLVDAGEPGTLDKAGLKIFETAHPSNVVLNLPLTFMNTGNLQAHFDQPHKNDNGSNANTTNGTNKK